ncbi:MAG: glycogen synthase GlgA, partial [Ghiorsea sp.]|nr:glycogen synthase GlgA [Ghiorsea sp.]
MASKAQAFIFEDATAQAFAVAVEQAVAVFKKPTTWSRIRTRALKRDSSWAASAEAYVNLYTGLLDD